MRLSQTCKKEINALSQTEEKKKTKINNNFKKYSILLLQFGIIFSYKLLRDEGITFENFSTKETFAFNKSKILSVKLNLNNNNNTILRINKSFYNK